MMEGISEVVNDETQRAENNNVNTATTTPLPPPKKRKLTKEEKLELKNQKKIQKKLKAIEDRKQTMRDHLLRELKYTELSHKRGFTDWVKMCREIKFKELQEELMNLWQEVNALMDRKNHQIHLLQEDLVLAEEQYQRNFSKHVEIMEYLIKFFEYSLKAVKVTHEKEAYDLIKSFMSETKKVNGIQEERKEFCENYLHATNFAFQKKLEEMKRQFEEEKTDIIDSNIEKRYVYKVQTTNNMKQLYNQLLSIVQSLQQEALDPKRNTRYNLYVEKQDYASSQFAEMTEAADKGQDMISQLHRKLYYYETNTNYKITELKNERMFLVEHYWKLKENYKKDVQFADSQLSVLANESYRTLTNLKSQKRYGELLIGLAQCCSKLQTEKEKVMPWPWVGEMKGYVKLLDDTDEAIDRVGQMELFWYRVSCAQSHVLCLKEEKRKLQEENAMFCDKLKSCYEVETYDEIIKSLTVDAQFLPSDACQACGGKSDKRST